MVFMTDRKFFGNGTSVCEGKISSLSSFDWTQVMRYSTYSGAEHLIGFFTSSPSIHRYSYLMSQARVKNRNRGGNTP